MDKDLPLTVENAEGTTIATLSESLLSVAIYVVERLKNGGTIKRDGEFLYRREQSSR